MKRTRALAVLLSLSMALQPVVTAQAADVTANAETAEQNWGVQRFR